MQPIVDAHQHFWRLDQFDFAWLEAEPLAPIRRDFLPADLAEAMAKTPVAQTVLVQTQHNLAENDWFLSLADQNDWIAGVVGWVDLASEACEEQLLKYREHPKFVGVRHIVQDEPDDDFIIREDVLRGLGVLARHDVPYDLLFYHSHLKHAAAVARRHPELRLVIDHLSKPAIREGRIDHWREDLAAAAACPNVWCKLSGMVTEADWKEWKPSHLEPYVAAALDLFGPERCMFGSDWPVCLLAADYPRVYNTARDLVGDLSPDEQLAIFGGTATKFYGLDLAESAS